MENSEFSNQILAQIHLSTQDSHELITVQVIRRDKLIPVDQLNTISTADRFLTYIIFITRVDIYETERIWINQGQYELKVNFTRSVNFIIPPLKFEISIQAPCLGILDTEGRILLLRINGDFHGSIQNK